MQQLKKQLEELLSELKQASQKISLDSLQSEQKTLQKQLQSPDFWQNSQKAQEISKRQADLARRISPWQKLINDVAELKELAASGDKQLQKELNSQLNELQKQFEELKKQLRFSGPFDDHDVILSIHP